ncbi:hypothetical protein M514_24528 [Trichuris suis]|uniref:Uncharacterized protein n=1 Tax=Trichuris suis TaxID=68888 RepID=A0A085N1K2_9BILA|nr:hypothetical protein M514_24528 [Trichuris suis]
MNVASEVFLEIISAQLRTFPVANIAENSLDTKVYPESKKPDLSEPSVLTSSVVLQSKSGTLFPCYRLLLACSEQPGAVCKVKILFSESMLKTKPDSSERTFLSCHGLIVDLEPFDYCKMGAPSEASRSPHICFHCLTKDCTVVPRYPWVWFGTVYPG